MQALTLMLAGFWFCFTFYVDMIPINFKLQYHWGRNLVIFIFYGVGNSHYHSILGLVWGIVRYNPADTL